MGNRRQSREAALAFLYQSEVYPASETALPQRFLRHFQIAEPFQSYFLELVEGVQTHRSELDSTIEGAAEHWKLYRMARVDLSILRMASWELRFQHETDYQVILDEAIELAKEYGSQDSASFVNGILDKISKQVRLDNEIPDKDNSKSELS